MKFDDSDKYLLTKLEEIAKDINDINITLVKQNISLEEHVRRTDLLEKQVDSFKEEFKPIQRKYIALQVGLQTLGVIGIIASIYRAFK